VLPRRLGRYHLFAHIGQGGMADIYLAQADTGFGGTTRLVVIKEVLPRLAQCAEFSEMLVSEAKLAAGLGHANVVKVEDLGRADGRLFIAMEYVEGIDLREVLRRCALRRVALPVEFSLRIVIEALRGLSFAHRARDGEGRALHIVHRDVSPSNVLLSFAGEVKLCDFGIARAGALAGEAREKAVQGKAGYMSPEQAWGEALDARSDVYAVGIILWELLAGRRLYKAGEGECLLDVARTAIVPPLPARDLPLEGQLHAIVARALQEAPRDRYPTAAAMLHDLEEYEAAARMVASQIRFGEWLMDHFGQEIVLDRRARERAMRALARGPAAVIQPISRRASRPGRPPDATLSEPEATPSAFPVSLRASSLEVAPEEPERHPEHGAVPARASLAPKAGAVPRRDRPRMPSLQPRLLGYALLLAAIAYVALRLVVSRP
jgi:serine/threonine-protein kinase